MRCDPFRGVVLFLLLAVLSGCGSPDARFELNRVYMRKQEKSAGDFTGDQKQDVADALTKLFGTPDDPRVPLGAGMDELVDLDKLPIAAGPVRRDGSGRAEGLYRDHCVRCHGITGDGLGREASGLDPYPRDYRRGTFKFKSTPKGFPPTDDDLKRVLRHGVPGTAMPAFKQLTEGEFEALVDYVKYLAIRGEMERALYEELAIELDPGERLDMSSEFLVDILLADVVDRWADIESHVTEVPAWPDWKGKEKRDSIEAGHDLFHGEVANCASCHGETALGDGLENSFDDWVIDFIGHKDDPEDLAKLGSEMVKYGGLRPQFLSPRNLRSGIYRGGERPEELYLRIKNGIDGGPMPAVVMKPEGSAPESVGLSVDDIWHLVDYVLSLPQE